MKTYFSTVPNMWVKSVIMALSVVVSLGFASARTLSPDEALARATNTGSGSRIVGTGGASHQYVRSVKSAKGTPEVYLYQSSKQGYLVLSAEESAVPVLGYSHEGNLTEGEMPEQMQWWLQQMADEIQYATEHNLPMSAPASVGDAIEPLIKSKWGQDWPYNLYTPVVNGVQSPTGCVATAMAQIMYYHKWPINPTGSGYCSTTDRQSFEMGFDGIVFEWDKMKDEYNRSCSDEDSMAAVSTLMKCAGYGAKMKYGSYASGAGTLNAQKSLINNFGYSQDITGIGRYDVTLDDWNNILYNQLSSKLPVLYEGDDGASSRHVFICDGYDGNGYFHFNWGWDGICDGYFITTSLTPIESGTGGNNNGYNGNQAAIINIYPDNSGLECVFSYLSVTNYQWNNNRIYFTFEKIPSDTDYEVGLSLNEPFDKQKEYISIGTFNGKGEVTVSLENLTQILDASKTYDVEMVWKPTIESSWERVVSAEHIGEYSSLSGGILFRLQFNIENNKWEYSFLTPVIGIELNQSVIMLNKGETENLQATATPDYMTDKSIAWTSSDTSVATVDADGKVTAAGAGECDIAATTHNGLTASCHVKVIVNPTGITLDAEKKEILLGQTFSLSATLAPADVTEKAITWTTSDTSVSSVDAEGKATAVGVGEADITATTTNGITATCHVKVLPILVSSITLSSKEIIGEVGNKEQISASVLPENATTKTLTWASTDTSVATVDADGNVAFVKAGTATITATATDGSGASATCAVTVKQPATGIEISETSVTIQKGEAKSLTASVGPDDASDKSIAWTSSDTSVASVDAEGTVTAIDYGETIITATTSNGLIATCNVSVVPILVESIEITPNVIEVETGKNFILEYTVYPEDADNKELAWESSDETVASVTSEGVVIIKGEGYAVITASATDGSGVYATCEVTGVSGVDEILAEGREWNIYTEQGILLRKKANREDVEMLQQGIYIITDGVKTYKIKRK